MNLLHNYGGIMGHGRLEGLPNEKNFPGYGAHVCYHQKPNQKSPFLEILTYLLGEFNL